MYSKGNPTGDLAGSMSGGLKGIMGRSRDEFSSPTSFMDDEDGEQITEASPDNTKNFKTDIIESKSGLLYSRITTLNMENIKQLESQLEFLEFKSIFRFPDSEIIEELESPSYWHQNQSSITLSGTLFLSSKFISFASSSPLSSVAISSLSTHSNLHLLLDIPIGSLLTQSSILISTSMLFDSTSDVVSIFAIPYPHITSVTKPPATGLKIISSLNISGYILINTRNKLEYWISFSSLKTRDKLFSDLMNKIKSIGLDFDGNTVIGLRNGSETRDTTSVTKRTQNLNDSFDEYSFSQAFNTDKDIKTVALRLLFPHKPIDGLSTPTFISLWNEYMSTNGNDISMIKDLKRLRELIVKTCGIPNQFRGDLWMFFCGAWYSKPDDGYYETIVQDHEDVVGPFTEEIEKDVHRYLFLTIEVFLSIQHINVQRA